MNRKSFFKNIAGLLAAPLLPLASLAIGKKIDIYDEAVYCIGKVDPPKWVPKRGDIVIQNKTGIKFAVIATTGLIESGKEEDFIEAEVVPVVREGYFSDVNGIVVTKENTHEFTHIFNQMPQYEPKSSYGYGSRYDKGIDYYRKTGKQIGFK